METLVEDQSSDTEVVQGVPWCPGDIFTFLGGVSPVIVIRRDVKDLRLLLVCGAALEPWTGTQEGESRGMGSCAVIVLLQTVLVGSTPGLELGVVGVEDEGKPGTIYFIKMIIHYHCSRHPSPLLPPYHYN